MGDLYVASILLGHAVHWSYMLPIVTRPEGNPTCWDGLHFIINGAVLPRPYFQDLSSTCAPQSSFVAVAATVLVSTGLLLVRPPFCEEKQLQEGGNRLNHEYSVDNAKFLTSIFFVLARICGGSPADKPASGLQRFAFTYHCRVWFLEPFFFKGSDRGPVGWAQNCRSY